MKVRNRTGPRIDLWGMPKVTFREEDFVPFTDTGGVWSEKNPLWRVDLFDSFSVL